MTSDPAPISRSKAIGNALVGLVLLALFALASVIVTRVFLGLDESDALVVIALSVLVLPTVLHRLVTSRKTA